jgi:hypothetical protein
VHPLLPDVMKRTILNIQPTPLSNIVFTDDWAPIEQLTDSIAVKFIFEGNLATLR